jgi:hypothetical protein
LEKTNWSKISSALRCDIAALRKRLRTCQRYLQQWWPEPTERERSDAMDPD